jgi:hypothetical protein
MEGQRDGETEGWRDGGMERPQWKDGETLNKRTVRPDCLSVSPSLCPSVAAPTRNYEEKLDSVSSAARITPAEFGR